MNNDLTIRLETSEDFLVVERLTRDAFWNKYRPGCLEPYVLHQFRKSENFVKELSLVLELNGRIIGHIMFAKSKIICKDKVVPVLTFGPFSILPQEQGKGYGKILLDYAMNKAMTLGATILAIEGDPDLYAHFGFVKGKSVGIIYAEDPSADYFLVKELCPNALSTSPGKYYDPKEYFVDENDAVEYIKNMQ